MAENTAQLSWAITFDLLITTPIIYYLTIRKRAIPKTTVVPVFILGVLIASIITPSEHQYYLSLVKTWFLPILEISIIAYVVITIRKGLKEFKRSSTSNPDFYTAAKNASSNILPKALVIPFATELSVFYYGLINWKRRTLRVSEFTYYKNTSTRLVLGVFFFLIIIETFSIHLLIHEWSKLLAWILTGLSIYTCFQILGIARSITKRPISISDSYLILNWGIMNETAIKTSNIASIEKLTKEVNKDSKLIYLSPFHDMEGHNIRIKLKQETTMTRFYGMKKRYQQILVYIDDPDRFIDTITIN